MMKKLFSILLFLTLYVNGNAQVKLHIQELSKSENIIQLQISAKNISETDSVLFYFPRDSSVFMSLINITFQEKETGKTHKYWPSNEILDIDRIFVNKSNSALLHPGHSHAFEHDINLKRVFPFLKKSKYLVSVHLSYEYGCLETELGYKLFKGTVKSNVIEIENSRSYP